MPGTTWERKVSIGAVAMAAVVPVALIVTLLLIVSGCGDEQTGSTGTVKTTTTTKTTPTNTYSPETTVQVPQTPTPGAGGATALRIVDYAVDPDPVHAGAPLTCMVTVEGTATSVRMGLTGPSGSTSQTVNLVEGTTVGGVTNWTATVAAPVTVGGWRFGATAVAADGTEVIPDAGGLSASLLPFEVIP